MRTITEPAPKSIFWPKVPFFFINGKPSLHLVGNFKRVKETGFWPFTLKCTIQYKFTAGTRFTHASSGKKNRKLLSFYKCNITK